MRHGTSFVILVIATLKNWKQPQYPLIGDAEINARTAPYSKHYAVGDENEQGCHALVEPFPR